MHKYQRQRDKVCHTIPHSVVVTIRDDAPTFTSTHETNSDWLETYSTNLYSKSLFYKGPLLFTDFVQSEAISQSTISFKNSIKRRLLTIQASGDSKEWCNENFKLYNIRGLRKSKRKMAQPHSDITAATPTAIG